MWLHAVELAEQTDRLQRRFVRYLGPGADCVSWEPPVDIFETDDGFSLVFALPGVDAADIEVRLDHAALVVTAERRPGLTSRDIMIRRLEIPHGRFIRKIALNGAPLKVDATRYLNGCLEVRLVRLAGGK